MHLYAFMKISMHFRRKTVKYAKYAKICKCMKIRALIMINSLLLSNNHKFLWF